MILPNIPSIVTSSTRDLLKLKASTYSNKTHIQGALSWLKKAQDVTQDGGVAAYYSLINGWANSFIETTGYIISTFLECYSYFKDEELYSRAIKMADFLLEMQMPDGSFRQTVPSENPHAKPVIFNVGQDLLGLVDIYQATKDKKYYQSCIKAADFLCRVQKDNGSWEKFQYGESSHTYDTRVAWALLKTFVISQNKKYKERGLRHLEWATTKQLKNGWFEKAQLPPPNPPDPYTHTIAYTIEGFLYSGILLREKKYIDIAEKTAKQLLDIFEKSDVIPATFDKKWQSQDKYSCLTGNAQISIIWFTLFTLTKQRKYQMAGIKMNNQLKLIQALDTNDLNRKGAIAGSHPIYGDLVKNQGYCRMAYLNWATKFFIDAMLAELKTTAY